MIEPGYSPSFRADDPKSYFRAFLRPHGRSAENVRGSCTNGLWAVFDDKTMTYAYDTRAQAAQAAYRG